MAEAIFIVLGVGFLFVCAFVMLLCTIAIVAAVCGFVWYEMLVPLAEWITRR